MKLVYSRLSLFFFVFYVSLTCSQETLPIYTDYLSDNVFLLHPSAAGIGNSSKLRLTTRQQWSGVSNAPALQSISYHTKFGEDTKAGYGIVLFNDKNGFHSQKGLQGAYAYHLPMDNGNVFNQLSFGLAFTLVQNQSDQTSFVGDPAVSQIVESTSYYNADFSVAYHLGGLSSYFTVKNMLLSAKNHLNAFEPLNLRNYILYAGYYLGDEDSAFQFEPSFMAQFKESLGEKIFDLNFKVYKTFDDTRIWAALSLRKHLDDNAVEDPQFVSPILGINYKKFMFSYTYTKQMNDIVLTDAAFHQITIGLDLFTREKRGAACPNINSAYGSF